ncbi:hypothetical protein ACRAWD_16140 [Caulobacter segnis]
MGFWTVLALAGAIALGVLLAAFILFRIVLMQTGAPSLAALKAINPDQPLRMSRLAAPPPKPTSTQLQRIQAFLAPEIAEHLVTVEQDAQSIRVRTTIGTLFKSGDDKLNPSRRAAVRPHQGGGRDRTRSGARRGSCRHRPADQHHLPRQLRIVEGSRRSGRQDRPGPAERSRRASARRGSETASRSPPTPRRTARR